MKSYKQDRDEKIARLYLSYLKGTRLVEKNNKDKGVDFWLEKGKNQRIAVEVKSTTLAEKNKISQKFESVRNRFSHQSNPGIVIYINGDEEKGYFEVFNKGVSDRIYTLTGNTISTQIEKIRNITTKNKVSSVKKITKSKQKKSLGRATARKAMRK